MTDVFINYLSSTGALSVGEIHFSVQFFKPIRLKKGDFLFGKMKPAVISGLSPVVL